MDYEAMLLYVKKVLEENNAIRSPNLKFSFRNRYEHIKRVFNWCSKLLEDKPNCNKEMVLTAAIFHDIGYCKGKDNHAHFSAMLFIEYAKKHNMDYEFMMHTADIISLHSDKSLLKEDNIPDELVLLLEADLLDEEGALGIVWDLMGGRCYKS